jgi:hypothetical protein
MPEHSLDNVTIDGFRGLRHLRLDGLGRINIVVGENNSGKTSVLEALSILCNAYHPFEWISIVRRRDFGLLDETRIQSLRWCFPQAGQLVDPDLVFEGECKMTCDGIDPLLKTLRVTYRDLVGEPDPQRAERRARGHVANGSEEEEDDIGDTQLRRGAEITHFLPNNNSIALQVWEDQRLLAGSPSLFGSRLATATLTPYSYQINRIQVQYHTRALFGASREIVLDLIREFDPEITAFEQASFQGDRPALYLNHRRLGLAPLSVFGDGLRRAVLLAGTLLSLSADGVLLIDEVEAGIHVTALQRVFRWLADAARKLNVQVVATTHSLEAVDAMALSAGDAVGDLVTFHLDQTEQETRVKRIDGELLLRLRRERGLDVR